MQIFGRGGRTLIAPRIATIPDAVRAASTSPTRIVGSAANMLAAAWPSSEPVPPLVEDRRAPDIDWVGTARCSPPNQAQGSPKPLYLRTPDAQPQDAARLPRR